MPIKNPIGMRTDKDDKIGVSVRIFPDLGIKLANAEYYSNKYGVVSGFKAGLHSGVLMLAEVGIVKNEL